MNDIDVIPAEALVLFSTTSCALCDHALELLLSMPEVAGRSLRVLEVADDEGLLARYGERLPVLRVGDIELDWPFDRGQVARLMR